MKPDSINVATTALLEPLLSLARQASDAICQIYSDPQSLVVERKGDKSPVTQADKLAHDIIKHGLSTLPGAQYPVLSEEMTIPSYAQRSQWSCYWLVDPLDGTKEFIERTGEFTINIALIEHGRPTLGLIYQPLEQRAWYGVVGEGVWHEQGTVKKRLSDSPPVPSRSVRVLSSRRHAGADLEGCLEQLEKHFVVERLKEGSALKFCRLVEGGGDIYPRFSPCCEWDTAAGQALLEAAGGAVLDMSFKPLRYNLRDSLIVPPFYAFANTSLDWRSILASAY